MTHSLTKLGLTILIGVCSGSCTAQVAERDGDEAAVDISDENSDSLVSATQLRVGLTGGTGDEMFGKGPVYSNGQWSGSEPIYRVTLGRISPGDLPSAIQEAKQKDILIVLNMAGSRNNWTHEKTLNGKQCLMYDAALYHQRIDEYVGVSGLKDALAARRVIIYVVDEPNIVDFCDSITPTEANEMGLYTKKKFPGAITLIRSGSEVLTNGFAGQGPLGSKFWSGIDYGYGLYKGWQKQKFGKTAAQFYPEEKKKLALLNLGMVMGLNNLNHGDWACWDYKHDGSSWGRVRGQNQALNGGVPCSQGMGGEINWLASPGFLREVIDAAVADPDAPFLTMWTHIYPNSNDQEFKPYEIRTDYVSAYKYMISKGRQRAKFNGWRPAK